MDSKGKVGKLERGQREPAGIAGESVSRVELFESPSHVI